MIYEGSAVSMQRLDNDIVELKFDLQGESVNKFNQATIADLKAALASISGDNTIKGMVVTSGKGVFIVGADITEFTELFKAPEAELIAWTAGTNDVFNTIEDLPFPTVSAINGVAMGGGLEVTLATDFRVLSDKAVVALPEVSLGIYPGFGGTVRMPRVAGFDVAVEWICAGKPHKPQQALDDGVVDAVVDGSRVKEAALDLLGQCISGEIDYKAKRQLKLEPLALPPIEQEMAFYTARGMVAQQAGPNYPAPMAALETMIGHAGMGRADALAVEGKNFTSVVDTSAATALVGIFLNDQALKKISSKKAKGAEPVARAAVLGAGIMGGGIAYQSALTGTPITMKDIAQPALDLGMSEAGKLLSKQVDRKKMKAAKMAGIISTIQPKLDFGGFDQVDFVIEAVVENEGVKKSVLAETEGHIKDDAILASNTSTISITRLAEGLKRPEQMVGMHFFNPVAKMPLVEIIRGAKTSDATVARAVAFATKLKKSPVVVNDCPGFLVNRVLFPYFGAFHMLLRDGADFQKVDKVMEKFGWPMGPAYLMDVVGIDTGVHAAKVMAEGIPERMNYGFKEATTVMFENERYGQKNGKGFYQYLPDRKGRIKKTPDETSYELLKPIVAEPQEFDAQTIIDRLMLPMCMEMVRCLEEGVVGTAVEADMALIMGLGFPAFRGGAIRYLESIGLKKFIELCDQYTELSPLYAPTERLREMAAKGETFYG